MFKFFFKTCLLWSIVLLCAFTTYAITALAFNYQKKQGDIPTASVYYIGSAFFINDQGYLVTDNHMVKGARLLYVKYKDKFYTAGVIKTDVGNDLALIRINIHNNHYFTLRTDLGPNESVLRLGYHNPDHFGYNLHAFVNNYEGWYIPYIRYKFAFKGKSCHGNSGGPVVNYQNEVVAVTDMGDDDLPYECSSVGIDTPADIVIQFLKSAHVKFEYNTSVPMTETGTQIVSSAVDDSTVVLVVNIPVDSSL